MGGMLQMFRADEARYLPIFISAHFSVLAFLTPTLALLSSETSSCPDSFFTAHSLCQSVRPTRLLE